MKILNHHQIEQKIKRLAIEILENNYDEPQIILAGINKNGSAFAQLLLEQLQQITKIELKLTCLHINPADPLSSPIELELPINSIRDKVIIIIDDVANTGRTMFYACKPLMDTLPRKIEVAVLVDRKHKSFPVKVDYVGLSLATTLMEDIDVDLKDLENTAVYLK